jgi:hypothetical protein
MSASEHRPRRKPIGRLRVAGALALVLLLAALGLWWREAHKPGAAASRATMATPAQLGSKCRFTEGDRAGEVADFAPLPPLPVGSSCNDGTSSSGVVVQ